MKYVVIVLLVISLFISGVVVYSLYRLGEPKTVNSQKVLTASSSLSEKDITLSFSPERVIATSSAPQTVDIVLSSPTQEVTSLQLELKYNSARLSNVLFEPSRSSFFGEEGNFRITVQDVNQKAGRVSFSIHVSEEGVGRRGSGPVGSLTFTPRYSSEPTTVRFTPATLVTSGKNRENLLFTTTPLTIISSQLPISSPSAIPTQ